MAAASEAASAGVSGLAEPLSACAVSLGAGDGMMPVPSLIGWVAVAGGTAGFGAGAAVDPPLGTRRTPVSGVPLAGPEDDGSLLWPRRMVTPPCWAWADCAAVSAASTRRG